MARRLRVPAGHARACWSPTSTRRRPRPARACGPGDVILKVNGQAVESVRDASRALQAIRDGRRRADCCCGSGPGDLRRRHEGVSPLDRAGPRWTPDCRALIVERIRERGPITVAEFMDLALYAPGSATTPVRPSGPAARAISLPASMSGRSSVRCWRRASPTWLARPGRAARRVPTRIDLVEVAAGNGRLPATCSTPRPGATRPSTGPSRCTSSSAAPRARSRPTRRRARHSPPASCRSGRDAAGVDRAASSSPTNCSTRFPVHVVRDDAVGPARNLRRARRRSPVERPRDALDARRSPRTSTPRGRRSSRARGEVNLAASTGSRDAARRLTRGYLVLIDYGFEAPELYSAARRGHARVVPSAPGRRAGRGRPGDARRGWSIRAAAT